MAKASKWLRHSKTGKTRSIAKRRIVASVRESVERSATLRGLRISERQADRKKHAPKAKPERERQASADHLATEASGEEAYTSDAPEEATEEKQVYAIRDGKRRKRTLLGFLLRVVAPACLGFLLLLYLCDLLNQRMGWNVPLGLDLVGIETEQKKANDSPLGDGNKEHEGLTPFMPTVGLQLWLDGKDLDGDGDATNDLTTGTKLPAWVDKSSHWRHASQSKKAACI
jgi:hypothetical protein